MKLKYLEEENAHRKAIAKYYYDTISNPAVYLPERVVDDQNVYHLFPVFSARRDELQAYLKDNGVGTLIHYPIPPHKQECYREYAQQSRPITERITREELSIPMAPTISQREVATIVSLINCF